MRCRGLTRDGCQIGLNLCLVAVTGICFVPKHALASELPFCYQEYDLQSFQSASCPAVCGYTLECRPTDTLDGTEIGTRSCIPRSECATLLPDGLIIDDPETGLEYLGPRCDTVGVLGCAEWTNGSCTRCAGAEYVVEADGKCHWTFEFQFLIIVYLALFLILWILVDVCRAAWAPTVNGSAIRAGVKARFRAQFRQLGKKDCPPYSLTAQLHETTRRKTVTPQPIGGPGLIMFFNWFWLVIPLGVWLLMGAYRYAPLSEVTPCEHVVPQEVTAGHIGGTVSMQLEWKEENGEIRGRKGHLRWAIWNYAGACVMTTLFFIHQERLWSLYANKVRGDASMHRYCVELRGFPPEATDKIQLNEFVKKELRHWCLPEGALLYTSIAFSFPRSQLDHINRALDANLRRAKKRYTASIPSASGSDVDQDTPWAGPFWIQFLAWVMLGAPLEWFQCCRKETEGDEVHASNTSRADNDVTRDIQHLSASGSVFVVFETEPVAKAFSSIGKLHTRWVSEESDGEQGERVHVITSHDCKVDPSNIRWQDYFPDTKSRRLGRILKGALKLALLLVLWIYIYAMFTEFVVSSKFLDSSTLSVSFMMESLLGVLIFFGNACLAYGVQGVTEDVGFRYRSTLLFAQLCLVVPIVGLNTVVDLFIARLLAVNRDANFAWWKTFSTDFFKLWEPFDFYGYNPYSSELQSELIALAPTYAMLPYLAEPIGTVLLPLMIAIWRIKQDTRVTAEEASRWLLPPEVELVNPPYNDIVNVTNFVIYTFWVLPGTYHTTMFCYYLGFGILLYLQMRYRVLRLQMYTFFGSDTLHKTTCYLWAMPLSFMAACVGKEAYNGEKGWYTSPRGFNAAIIHIVCHFILVAFVLPTVKVPSYSLNATYQEETGMDREDRKPVVDKPIALATYFNTNPIEVLRRETEVLRQPHINADQLPVFYRIDMAYLQPYANHTFVNEEAYSRMFEMGPLWQFVNGCCGCRQTHDSDMSSSDGETVGQSDRD